MRVEARPRDVRGGRGNGEKKARESIVAKGMNKRKWRERDGAKEWDTVGVEDGERQRSHEGAGAG